MTTGFTEVPNSLWQDIVRFFAALFAPCKDCVRGSEQECWQGNSCPSFKFRPLAIRVAKVRKGTLNFANWVVVENELLLAVRQFGRPVRPSEIRLDTTRSKVVKSQTISRLVRQGRLVETRTGRHSRLISIPPIKGKTR